MKQLDQNTVSHLEIPAVVLMERAALFTVDRILKAAYDLQHVIVLAGRGNNGGDGVCVARILKEKGYSPEIFVIGNVDETSECAHQIRIAFHYDIPVFYGEADDAAAFLKDRACTLLIDAMFGVGFHGALEASYCSLIRLINEKKVPVVCIDIPTGVDASTGKIASEAVKADLTVTFGSFKIGQFLYPATQFCGKVEMDPIGIYPGTDDETEDLFALEESDLSAIKRPAYSNKSTFGKVLLIAGSDEIGGAAVLSAKSAFRSGAGMVSVYTSPRNRDVILKEIPEVMVHTYETDLSGLKDQMAWADVIAIGPGISHSQTAADMLDLVLRESSLPLILDADALILPAKEPERLNFEASDRTVIITPHLGEFSKLTKKSIDEIKEDLPNACRTFAKKHHVICVLKDARTLISDGVKTYMNTSGNSGMATAGSGDVLFGLIASLLGQGLTGLDAAAYGCYIHGLAGESAAKKHGEAGMVASDMIEAFHEFMI